VFFGVAPQIVDAPVGSRKILVNHFDKAAIVGLNSLFNYRSSDRPDVVSEFFARNI
jgi:hypothetical protein